MKIIEFNTYEYNFKDILDKVFPTKNGLDFIHETLCLQKVNGQQTDQKTQLHSKFYNECGVGSEFNKLYVRMVRDFLVPQVFNGEKVVYQTVPTFRVHAPNNIAVGEFHRDRDYAHNPAEVNFFMPFTRAFDTNTIWIETAEGLEDYQPMEANYGQLVIFDGANLKHGNKLNETGRTRVSVDFRIMLAKDFVETGKLSINGIREMKVGSYYEEM